MTKGLIATAAAGLAAAAVVATAVAKTSAPAGASQVAQCTNVSLGMLAPLTGPAAFLGQEQLSWVRFAVSKFNRQYGTRFKVVLADTQLSASLARTAGRRLNANPNVMAVIGGSTSQSVISTAGLFKRTGLVSISGSATRVDLTNGQFPTFFRVVPHDGIQAPNIVAFLTKRLRVDNVVVIDSQDDYSVPLAQAIARGLRRAGVEVSRESVAADETDFSSIVANVSGAADIVVFATQTASAAQTLSQQLREQGKRAVVFGTDGAYSPTQFKPRLGYVSSFANDLRFLPSARPLVREYNRFSRNKPFGTFGPPSYMAAWVAMTAIRAACADGRATRPEVTEQVRRTNVPSILGGRIQFTRNGDVRGAKFYIFRVTDGQYRLVG
ncbi:MAG TPA: branched-chain amino acid ABC transporter substrate-binding protein [Gaiellaceae bacterium]|nr:branched-chain amino acid ABC transporter substrate-binding protein [Gaiellaceae bacterium]